MKINKPLMMADGDGGGTPPPAPGTAGAPPAPGTTTGGTAITPPPDWKLSLPEDLRANPLLATLKGPEDLAKGYINAQGLIGAKRIALPGEKATDAERAEFYKAIGRPEAPDKYSEAEIKPDPRLNIDAKSLGEAKGKMFELGLTDAQQKGIMEFYFDGLNKTSGAILQTAEAAQAKATESLKAEWGDKYDANIDVAKAVVAKFADQSAIAELQAGLGNNTGLIKMFHKLGVGLLEDRAPGSTMKIEVGGPAAAQARIAELKLDKEFQTALNDNTHTGHKAAVELWTNVHRQASPGQVSPQ